MGRNERPDRISLRLSGVDPRVTVALYAIKCRSALYSSTSSARPMKTMDAAFEASSLRPAAGTHWLDRLRAITDAQIRGLFGRLPTACITDDQRRFSADILRFNRDRILTEPR